MKINCIAIALIVLNSIFYIFADDAQVIYAKNCINSKIISLKFSRFVFESDTVSGKKTSEQGVSRNKRNELDAPVFAEANDSISFNVKSKKFFLNGGSKIRYKNISLESENIKIDFEKNVLEARPGKRFDDSLKQEIIIGYPVLREGDEIYYGEEAIFNFKTQRGSIANAKTASDNSRYAGEKIYKADKDVYFARDITFTTCDLEPPHFDFYAKDMKLIKGEQIIVRWIWFRVAETPFPLPLPFGVFPQRSGRQSGFIIPAYGKNYLYGYYFSNFGYFWAINDYMDLTLTSTYYLKGGYALNSRFRYVKRYSFGGSIEANYSDLKTGEPEDLNYSRSKDYRIAIVHNQTLTPFSRLDANLNFQSGSYFRNNSYKYDELLKQDIVSNATYTTAFEEIGASFFVNYQRNQNLQTGRIFETLPGINFSKSVFYPFKSGKSFSQREASFYENIATSYSASFRNDRSNESGKFDNRTGFTHNVNVFQNQKLSYFNFSQSISYNERLYFSQIKKEMIKSPYSGNDTLITKDVNKIGFLRTFVLSANSSTKLYGVARLNALGVDAFRHTFNPSISLSFSPDFSEKFWGYYGEYVTPEGKTIKYDKFQNGIFGGAPRGRNFILTFSAANLFEIKTLKDYNDSLSQSKKIQLLNLNFSFNYNFAADSLKLSPLNVSYRTQIGNLLNLSGSSSFSFYDEKNGVVYDKFYYQSTGKLARLTFFSLSASTNLSDKTFKEKEVSTQIITNREDAVIRQKSLEQQFKIPWSVSLNYNYSISMPSKDKIFRASNIYGSVETSLSPNWRISASASYDLIKREISAPFIRIYRDLHCWEMSFNWNPLGIYRGYRLEIRAKASQLQDLKITKSKDIYSR